VLLDIEVKDIYKKMSKKSNVFLDMLESVFKNQSIIIEYYLNN